MLGRSKLVKTDKMVKSQSLTLTWMVKWPKCPWTKLVEKANILLDT